MCVNHGIAYSKHWISKGYNEDQILIRKSNNVNWLFRLFNLVLFWICGKFWKTAPHINSVLFISSIDNRMTSREQQPIAAALLTFERRASLVQMQRAAGNSNAWNTKIVPLIKYVLDSVFYISFSFRELPPIRLF